jgi:hypothetical protein
LGKENNTFGGKHPESSSHLSADNSRNTHAFKIKRDQSYNSDISTKGA